MQNKEEWSEDKFDVWLYENMDAEGKHAWKKIFGLPKLLNDGNPPAYSDKDAEIEA